MVTADLPAFMQVGQRIDVTVSAMGNAKSLRGGVLLMTELRGADGQVYAIAQGSLLVSGFEASGQAASTTVNIPTVAQIPGGATIERTVKSAFAVDDTILLDLDDALLRQRRAHHRCDQRATGPGRRGARPGADRRPRPRRTPATQVRFVAELLDIRRDDRNAGRRRGRHRRAKRHRRAWARMSSIGPAAVAYGRLAVTVNETPQVSQPAPFSQGTHDRPCRAPRSRRTKRPPRSSNCSNAPQVSDIVRNLNAIGATSSDLIAILQALKQSGALHARIKVI